MQKILKQYIGANSWFCNLYIVDYCTVQKWGKKRVPGVFKMGWGKGGLCVGLTTFMCRLSWNFGALASWNPLRACPDLQWDCFTFYCSSEMAQLDRRHVKSLSCWPERKQAKLSAHSFLTLALHAGNTSRSGRFVPGKDPRYPKKRNLGGSLNRLEQFRRREKSLAPAVIRTSDRPARCWCPCWADGSVVKWRSQKTLLRFAVSL